MTRQISEYIARARSMPPKDLAIKVASMLQRKTRRSLSRLFYQSQGSFSDQTLNFSKNYIQTPDTEWLEKEWLKIEALAKLTLDHKFDLLGSGWKQVNIVHLDQLQIRQAKHINSSNAKKSREIMAMIPEDYKFIDWQLDFKAEYRWNANQWWEDIPYGHKAGVDIKVPWELSRLQHLPWLAYAYQKTQNISYAKEFENQTLDFIANNPPRFGVNWKCPMDVSIRCANWLVAFDLFRNAGHKFSDQFNRVFSNSLFDHGLFVEQNFEKATDFRGNHYLADIAGLTFVAYFLEGDAKITEWRKLCKQELLAEAEYQFHQVGSNFEGSTAYHRLSSEMLFYGLVLVELSEAGFLNKHQTLLNQIAGMALFAEHITKASNEIVQIGDNDSGRFLKLSPTVELSSTEPIEDFLDLGHLSFALKSLFTHDVKNIETSVLAKSLINSSSKIDKTWSELASEHRQIVSQSLFHSPPHNLENAKQTKSYRLEMPEGYQNDLEYFCYQDFGVCVFKSTDFFLSFRCGPVGQLGRGGHDHNDQLTIELYANGQDLIRDPGTYLYTAAPEQRNIYRSNLSHYCPQPVGKEMGNISKALFFIEKASPGTLVRFNEKGCLGYHSGFGFPVYREILLEKSEIVINDFFFGDHEIVDLNEFKPLSFSRGYGLKA